MDTAKEFERLYSRYLELEALGDEKAMQAFIREETPRLSEEVRNKLMLEMFIMAMEDEVRERDTITDIQEKGIAAINKLDALEKEVEEEPKIIDN